MGCQCPELVSLRQLAPARSPAWGFPRPACTGALCRRARRGRAHSKAAQARRVKDRAICLFFERAWAAMGPEVWPLAGERTRRRQPHRREPGRIAVATAAAAYDAPADGNGIMASRSGRQCRRRSGTGLLMEAQNDILYAAAFTALVSKLGGPCPHYQPRRKGPAPVRSPHER